MKVVAELTEQDVKQAIADYVNKQQKMQVCKPENVQIILEHDRHDEADVFTGAKAEIDLNPDLNPKVSKATKQARVALLGE